MDKFIVSARKYRPQNFSTVVGQGHITTTLKNAIKNNQLAHAFLFCGPRGVGKTTCARILGKTINCENRTEDGEACNVCQSCISFDRGTSLNIHELDAASNNSVDDIRALVDQVRFAPQAGKYKVYIVDEVHMLSASAFNAFLKTLEEPPPFAIFILATTEKHKILPTILSRCQIFDFKRITIQDTVDHLKEISQKENIHADNASLHLIAQKSEGCMRDSLSLFDKIVSFTNGDVSYTNTLEHLNILDEDYYFKLLEFMQEQKLSDALLTFDEINRKGFEGDTFLNGFAEFLRNMLVSKDAKVAALLEVSEDFKKKYKTMAAKTGASWIVSALNIVNEAEINLRQARNKRLHVEMVLIKLCYLNQAIGISESASLKKKVIEVSSSLAFKSLVPQLVKTSSTTSKPKNIPDSTITSPAGEEQAVSPQDGARLIIQERAEEQKGRKILPRNSKGKFESLEDIRQRIASLQKGSATVELNNDELANAWEGYIMYLENTSQPSAISSFRDAKLSILENDRIEIVSSSDFFKTFIEAERSNLISHLQSHFNNRMITYSVRVEEGHTKEEKAEFLNDREKFQRIAARYPALKKLKEKLNLRLDS